MTLPSLQRGTGTRGQLVNCPRPDCGKRPIQGHLPALVLRGGDEGHMPWGAHALRGLGVECEARSQTCGWVSWERRQAGCS